MGHKQLSTTNYTSKWTFCNKFLEGLFIVATYNILTSHNIKFIFHTYANYLLIYLKVIRKLLAIFNFNSKISKRKTLTSKKQNFWQLINYQLVFNA